MALKHAVLGLIVQRCGHGYEIGKRISALLGPSYLISPSGVYGALGQLEHEGLIVAITPEAPTEGERDQHCARRTIYENTAKGDEVFKRWLASSITSSGLARNELRLKVAVSGPADIQALLQSLEREELRTRQVYEECQAAMKDPGRDRDTWTGIASDLAQGAGLIRLKGDLCWMQKVRDSLLMLLNEQMKSPPAQWREGFDFGRRTSMILVREGQRRARSGRDVKRAR